MSPLDRHPFGVLQFSGGKDSLACLTLLKPHLDKIVVAWVNTGDAVPENAARMAEVRAAVPHFLEVNSNAPAWIERWGWPVELLPLTHTEMGRMIDGHDGPLFSSYTNCCAANLWNPLEAAVKELGATLVIRGQRTSEPHKGPLRSGVVVDGIEYWYPLEDWSEAQVFAYLRLNGIKVPSYYSSAHGSIDCMHCTAYLFENRLGWLDGAYPEVAGEVRRRLAVVADAGALALGELRQALL